ncbi:MAG: D-mannonate oxidoreductase [Bacteroidetes bacterium]|nr:MAG: D-mannonate oxidoreductase [Bacteroidota bacterium]
MNYLENLFNIKNKVALITGGGGVLAGKMAEGLIKSGAKVVLLDLKKESTQDLVKKLSNFGEIKGMSCNVLDKSILEGIKDKILSDFGKIDILINTAGGNMLGATISPDQTIFDMDMNDFDKVTELNLNGSILPSLVFGKVMAEQGSGSIINMSSMAVNRAITRVVGYSASKAAITNFTRWMAVEMARKFGDGIRVNALAPGFFIGKQNKALLTNEDGTYTERGHTIIQNTPMNRFGEAEELIGATLFLCSDAARFITGIVLPVDGGFSAFSGV